MDREAKVKVSTGSVYAELGYKNPEELQTKANLVIEIHQAIKKKKLTQKQAAKILGINQPKLSDLLRGRFRGYSIERLMCFLNELGKDVDIFVRTSPRARKARVKVYFSNAPEHAKAAIAAKSARH